MKKREFQCDKYVNNIFDINTGGILCHFSTFLERN